MKTKLLLAIYLSVFCFAADNTAPTQRDIDTGNLTDQQKVLMESAPNAGYQQRAYNDAVKDVCTGGAEGYSEAACKSLTQGGNASSLKKIMGMSGATMKGLAQVYTMFMGMAGGASTLTRNEGGVSGACKMSEKLCSEGDQKTLQAQNNRDKLAAQENPDKEKLTGAEKEAEAQNNKNSGGKDNNKKEQEDYCRFIPIGTEAMAMFQQKSETEFIQNTPTSESTNQQVEMLEKQSRTHGARAKTAKMQFIGWGATSACYVTMMTAGSVAPSPMTLAKLAGSTVLATYFKLEEKAHGEAKDIVNQIKTKFVGATKAGTCNPITQRDCYCSQPETQNDVTYCLPQIRNRLGQNTDYQLTCLTEDLVEDKTCSCVQSDTCLDKTIKGNLENIHIPQPASMALTPFFQMTKGSMKPGQTSYDIDANSGKLFAMAKDLLRDGVDLEIPLKNLNDEEKEALKELSDMGLPKNLAHALLSQKPTEEAKKNEKKFASGRFNFSTPKSGKNIAYTKNPQMNFRGGEGINSKKSKSSTEDFSSVLNKFKKKTTSSSANDGSILKFAETATRSAQITKDKDRVLFEIISRRYQVSARKRLDIVE